jgi:subtilase family serine protease
MRISLLAVLLATTSFAAPPNRIAGPIDSSRVKAVTGNLHRLAQAKYDQGPVDPAMRMEYMQVIFQPSAAQQADLDQLLIDQQNPSAAAYRRWLTPEQFGDRFGLSASDQSKIVAWLASEGFTIDETARGRNWVAFSGTAAQVSKSLHTEIHKLNVNGKAHYANMTAPSVPEAIAVVVGGIIGLHDFHPQSGAKFNPQYTSSAGTHSLAPEDFATIYDIGPLYTGGIDGTGVNIAIVGQSDILLSDMRAFRTRYGLPAKDPVQMLYGGGDPGFNDAQVEANLDLQWSGAVAPNATI